MIRSNMNPILLQSYQLGLIIGVIVVSTLILFPGTKNDDSDSTATAVDAVRTTTNNDTANYEISSPTSTTSRPSLDLKHPKDRLEDADTPNFLSPHRQLNWMVYILIYLVISLILFYSYTTSDNHPDTIPLYRRQLQSPMKLIQLTLEAYFPKEASLLFAKKRSNGNE